MPSSLAYDYFKNYCITAQEDCKFQYIIRGGGGGGGGYDVYKQVRAGGDGQAGSILSGYLILPKNESVYVAVGGGGGAGQWGRKWFGRGDGGRSLDGFSGGMGGQAGWFGTSGAGGGGGGATVIYKIVNSQKIAIAVAGGGGGGGGAGALSGGYTISPYTNIDSSKIINKYYPVSNLSFGGSTFLRTYGVWDSENFVGNENVGNTITLTYDVFLDAGTYTVDLETYVHTGITYADFSIDGLNAFTPTNTGIIVSGSTAFIRVASGNPNPTSKTLTIATAGWYIVRIYSGNQALPEGLAFKISNGNSVILTSRSPNNLRTTTNVFPGRGGAGQLNKYDGGGAGGGGGGLIGGDGGVSAAGTSQEAAGTRDVGASSGSPGTSGIISGYGVTTDWAPPSWDPVYQYGVGGAGMKTSTAPATPGGPGYAWFNSTFSSKIKVKTEQGWRESAKISVAQMDTNKQIYYAPANSIFVRGTNSWIKVYGAPVYDITDQTGNLSAVSNPSIIFPPGPVIDPIINEEKNVYEATDGPTGGISGDF